MLTQEVSSRSGTEKERTHSSSPQIEEPSTSQRTSTEINVTPHNHHIRPLKHPIREQNLKAIFIIQNRSDLLKSTLQMCKNLTSYEVVLTLIYTDFALLRGPKARNRGVTGVPKEVPFEVP